MEDKYKIPVGKYTVYRYAQIKSGKRWVTCTDDFEKTETVDEKHVSNIVNGYNPFSSKESITWNKRTYCTVISVSPDGTKRHVWDIWKTKEGK